MTRSELKRLIMIKVKHYLAKTGKTMLTAKELAAIVASVVGDRNKVAA